MLRARRLVESAHGSGAFGDLLNYIYYFDVSSRIRWLFAEHRKSAMTRDRQPPAPAPSVRRSFLCHQPPFDSENRGRKGRRGQIRGQTAV